MRRILPLFLTVMLLPAAASALTIQDVVTLAKAGVSEDVLLTIIDRDKTIFAIDANQLIALKREGVSERIVIAMLKSGREEPAPTQSASANMTAFGPSEPTLIIVGHAPDRPNTYHDLDRLGQPEPIVYGTGALLYQPPYPISAGPLLYQSPYPISAAVPRLRIATPCDTGRRGGSGSRQPAESACRRPR